MTPEELRILAASEHGYVASRLVTYREDGAPVPEPIRKLGALADAVLAFLPGLAEIKIDATVTDAAGAALADLRKMTEERDMFRDAHMNAIREHETTVGRFDKVCDSLAIARKALYDMSIVLGTANDKLDNSEPVKAQEAAPPSEPRHMPIPSPVAIGGAAWPASGLYHGLVLINGANERRLFGEPIKGQFTVQVVAPDGETAGEPWSTMADKWPASEWAEWAGVPIVAKPAVPKYDAPVVKEKAAKAPAVDRTLDMFAAPPSPPAPAAKTIGDYAPDDAQFVKWTEALSKALSAAGKEPVTVEKVRGVFDAWKAEHATEEKPNPAAAFWHAAKTTIVG